MFKMFKMSIHQPALMQKPIFPQQIAVLLVLVGLTFMFGMDMGVSKQV